MKTCCVITVCVLFVSVADISPSASTAPVRPVRIESNEEIAVAGRPRPKVLIQSSIDRAPWSNQRAIYPRRGQSVRLRVENRFGPSAVIHWYLVFADLTRNYNNAVPPWEEGAYKWRGMDQIRYFRAALVEMQGSWQIEPFAGDGLKSLWVGIRKTLLERGAPPHTARFYHHNVGTFWLMAEIESTGKTWRTHGIDDIDQRGISTKVFRISLRASDDYLGWVQSFYNVPGIFGSTLYQSKQFIGADCADLLMSALARFRGRKPKKNFNVQQLSKKLKTVTQFEIASGEPSETVKWGKDIRGGDFIAVRYQGAKKYVHVGALYEDENANGTLDSRDLVLHAGPDPLHLTRLEYGAFDGHVVVLRP